MKASNYLIFTLLIFSTCLFAQKKYVEDLLVINPKDIKTRNSEIQEYNVTLKWQNLDAITGTKINSNAVKATYIVGLGEGNVGWKNVSLAQIKSLMQEEFQGVSLPAFDDFNYKSMDTAFLSHQFYKDIPAEQQDLAKWLVCDAAQMQGLARYVFDSLEYKKNFIPKLFDDYEIKFENWVSFLSKSQRLVWSGINKHNNELCAIVKFESFYNPVKINNDKMQVKGRSLYYGEMWISLEDKQVEYAIMVEDVVMKLKSELFADEQLIDLQREVVFNKVN